MPGPTILFGFVVATLFGSVFHLIVGGDARRLALFLMMSWVGFALGHITGDLLGIEILDIGALNMLNATAGAFLAMLLAFMLTGNTA
ncbi:MAG: hypothetical protein L0154_11840 [Chloroflexi bacterium]|nr:hypothetical protein [Chloroflexota bacterium]